MSFKKKQKGGCLHNATQETKMKLHITQHVSNHEKSLMIIILRGVNDRFFLKRMCSVLVLLWGGMYISIF